MQLVALFSFIMIADLSCFFNFLAGSFLSAFFFYHGLLFDLRWLISGGN